MNPTLNFKPSTIWTGDNLEVMRGINSDCIDLIYLDPPFNSNANYAAPIGSEAAGAEFKDTWSLSDIDVEEINLIKNQYPNLYYVLLASMTNSNKSYLLYMAVRLLEMHRILKDTGSLYLHCDPTMSHYLKLVLDSIFWGGGGFKNEIVWHYRKWTNVTSFFQRNHDILLFYSKGKNIFNKIYVDPTESQNKVIERGYNVNKINKQTLQLLVYDQDKVNKLVEAGFLDLSKYDKIVNRDGQNKTGANDVWNINILHSQAKERVGYPTQKPLALLERIIKASSNEGDIVLDPFCGCATTLVAADRLGRDWVGIDISDKAAELVVKRIKQDQGMFQNIIHRVDIPKRTDLGSIPKYNSSENKQQLYGKQGGNCEGCNTHFEMRNLEVDHIISRNKGGTDHISNLQLLCSSCNRIKGNRGMPYLKKELQIIME